MLQLAFNIFRSMSPHRNNRYLPFMMMLILSACIRSDDWKPPSRSCNTDLKSNTTFQSVYDLYQGSTTKILEDLVVEVYVISSDEMGNFFNTIHLQDKASNPTKGFQMEMDLRDSYLRFSPGDKVYIHLQGLYLGRSKGIYKLGSAYTSFGNLIVGRIPTHAIGKHLEKSCDQESELVPFVTTIEDLEFQNANTLITIENIEFSEEELGKTYAVAEEMSERILIDCNDLQLVLLTSGYSDFSQEKLPEEMGTITGIYYPEDELPQLIIRAQADLNFDRERCKDLITEFTTDSLLISEIADPDNASSARFVELFYSGKDSLSLKGWHLDRYTNGNTAPGSTIDLSSLSIYAGNTLVLASNAVSFEQIYGFEPDLEAGLNSPADSNGDDNLVLVDPFGNIIDVFGVVGEDGSGTDHEFEDGRALRNAFVQFGNPVYTFSEWTLYNDTGGAGTVNQPQNAPQDFSPGIRD
ncbi:MAG: lamin tail domain-containing protein [Eudoraea sp.]|nr:lamin tail domain-containing protein [Eudoraea sp.]